jgi:hypothetical protein
MRSLLLFLLLAVVPAFPAGATQTILVFGDSISAGYGLQQGEGWVALLEQRIQLDKLDYQVVNASISGETTLGGLNRIPAALTEHQPAVVIVALGGNDGLRGNPLEEIRRNLIGIVAACRAAGAKVVVAECAFLPTMALCIRAVSKGFSQRWLDNRMHRWFLSCSRASPMTAPCFKPMAFTPPPVHNPAFLRIFIIACAHCCCPARGGKHNTPQHFGP